MSGRQGVDDDHGVSVVGEVADLRQPGLADKRREDHDEGTSCSRPARWRSRRITCSVCRGRSAFLLGAIVAPPDVVAPLAIARRLGLPRRLLVVLEGEGLANDATALILYRFAVVAISTGVFSLPQAAGHLRA